MARGYAHLIHHRSDGRQDLHQHLGIPLRHPDTVTTDRGAQFESELWGHLMILLGSKRIRTTAYHPCANGMVETSVDQLPLVLLNVRTLFKEDLQCTIAEMVYGTTLALPTDFLVKASTIEPGTFGRQLCNRMSRVHSRPTRPSRQHDFYMPPGLQDCSHVFVRKPQTSSLSSIRRALPGHQKRQQDHHHPLPQGRRYRDYRLSQAHAPAAALQDFQNSRCGTAQIGQADNGGQDHKPPDLRLLPPILVVSGLFGTVTRFFETGPFFSYWETYVYPSCRDYFWKDILMLNNFNLEDRIGSCLGQCWYVSVDTQLYLVAPLFILPLVYKEKLGKMWLYFVTLMSVMIPALIIYVNDLPPSNVMVGEKGGEYFEKVYLKPWTRAGPWVMGIWLGYVFHKQGKERFILKQWQVVVGWSFSTIAALLIQFGMYSYNTIPAKAMYEIMTQVTYGGLQRSVWAACLAWIVFACHNGYGGFVDRILSHPVWQPLGRITYSLYLVALPMQSAITFTARTHFVFTYIAKIFETTGALFISGVVAVLVSLSAESPILGLEKLLLRRPARRVDRTVTKTTDKLLPEDQIDTMGKMDWSGNGTEMEIEGNDNKVFGIEPELDLFHLVARSDFHMRLQVVY
ncbi:putative nose resistant to fluoxetine protein 6-like [Penaeus vannamei]|uniref:Putative nose resistant to fluoxetine protein 6-like n=1 Tax=Penaeus vannamei TaxID=6689 RepID=A0A3R7LX22_PENVA|nr:putative nose resistant to fluoxetine protein 6-like [Penaeus vannamei]